jgi:hypothetical protein
MGLSDRDTVTALKAGILAYLANHPGAADNAVGIQRWWLPTAMANAVVADVEAALAEMVNEGSLKTRHLPDGNVIFIAENSDGEIRR